MLVRCTFSCHFVIDLSKCFENDWVIQPQMFSLKISMQLYGFEKNLELCWSNFIMDVHWNSTKPYQLAFQTYPKKWMRNKLKLSLPKSKLKLKKSLSRIFDYCTLLTWAYYANSMLLFWMRPPSFPGIALRMTLKSLRYKGSQSFIFSKGSFLRRKRY